MPREKAGQCPCFNRLGTVNQSARDGQLDNMRIAKHFQVGLRKLPAQSCNGRKGQNEIADGATTNNENLALKHESQPARKTVAPKMATTSPNARRMVQPTLIRFSLAVPQSRRSRSRQGETVNHIPARTKR